MSTSVSDNRHRVDVARDPALAGGSRTPPFYLSRNEERLSRERPEAWRIYRLLEFG